MPFFYLVQESFQSSYDLLPTFMDFNSSSMLFLPTLISLIIV